MAAGDCVRGDRNTVFCLMALAASFDVGGASEIRECGESSSIAVLPRDALVCIATNIGADCGPDAPDGRRRRTCVGGTSDFDDEAKSRRRRQWQTGERLGHGEVADQTIATYKVLNANFQRAWDETKTSRRRRPRCLSHPQQERQLSALLKLRGMTVGDSASMRTRKWTLGHYQGGVPGEPLEGRHGTWGDIYLKDNDTDTDTAKGGADAHWVVRTAPRVRPVYVQRCAAPRACPKTLGPATTASEGAARGRARTRPERHKCRRGRV